MFPEPMIHLQAISYVDPTFCVEENSAWQFCVRSMKQRYMDNKLILMSLYLDGVRHPSHFTHSITRRALCLT
jgi:hypothetical protein